MPRSCRVVVSPQPEFEMISSAEKQRDAQNVIVEIHDVPVSRVVRRCTASCINMFACCLISTSRLTSAYAQVNIGVASGGITITTLW